MKLLAIETATEACSVAVHVDGTVIERFEIAPRRHAELTLPWAGQLLAEAGISRRQLDAVAISRGPGAFTGVRLAIAIAQGIALAIDRPLLAVSTLQALALRAPVGQQQVLAAIDARMGEVYAGRFACADGQWQAIDAEQVMPPQALALEGQGWFGVGTGFAAVDGPWCSPLARRWPVLMPVRCRMRPMSPAWRWRPGPAARRLPRNGSSRPTCATTWP